MPNGYIKTLQNSDKTQVIYPQTVSAGVIVESGNLYGGNANESLSDTLGRTIYLSLDQTITSTKTFSNLQKFDNTIYIKNPSNSYYTILSSTQTSTNRTLYLPTGSSDGYLVQAPSAAAIGSVKTPVYLNENGMITSCSGEMITISDLNNYVTLSEDETITGEKTFSSEINIYKETSIANNYPARINFLVYQTDNDIISGGNTGTFIAAYDDGDTYNYGTNLVIQGNSNVIIGSGESALSFYNNESSVQNSSENIHITSDSSINFWVNCQAIANRSRAIMVDNSAINLYKESRCWTNNYVIYMNDNVVRGTTPSTNYYQRLAFKDQAGHNLAYTEYGATTNGMSRLNLWVLGHNLDSEQYGGIYIYKNQGNTTNYTASYNANTGEFTATKIVGAVWNDYAEYRETKENIEPGKCIKETGKGDLILTTKRLEEGCEIVSDTFGFAIGQSEKCQTPTAATGRVLAYLYEESAAAHPGQPVCSGPNGTVSLMTNEEAREYPWCIIGTVSEIPDYDEWFCGGGPEESDQPEPIQVNGRIWIRVR